MMKESSYFDANSLFNHIPTHLHISIQLNTHESLAYTGIEKIIYSGNSEANSSVQNFWKILEKWLNNLN